MKHPLHKHIYKAGNKYYIQKSINNKLIFFKSCSTIDEAIKYRDKLKENNWKPLPLTDEELMEKQMKKYYMYVRIHGNTYNYVVCNRHEEYLGITKSIEEALYFRDLYIDTPKEEVPHIREVDLRTNNPYIENGLDYPLPERLILPERNSTYGKGSIVKKGETSYHLHHGKKGKGATSYVCSCATYEQAYYVREKLNECNWNLDELPRILDEYPVWYTELLYFYQYVNRHRVSTRQKAEKALCTK